MELELAPIVPRALLEETLRGYTVPIARKHIIATIECDPDLPVFVGDHHR